MAREHKVGPGTGYETDGTNYWLAPILLERFGEIEDSLASLDAILSTVVRSVDESRRHVERRRRHWWETVYADLALDKTKAYRFDRGKGEVSPVETPDEPKPKEDAPDAETPDEPKPKEDAPDAETPDEPKPKEDAPDA